MTLLVTVITMNRRLIMLIAIVFAALIVSGCCVCCIPCGRTRYAYATGESQASALIAYNISASPAQGNVPYNATVVPLPSPAVGPGSG
jgi:hypothetical protein